MSVWTDHREAYERVVALRDELAGADRALEGSRRAVIEHVSGIVGQEVGFEDRDAGSGDPLMDFVKAAESRYADNLGQYAARKPLKIEIVNPSDYSAPLADALSALAGTVGTPTGESEAPLDTEPAPGSSPAVE